MKTEYEKTKKIRIFKTPAEYENYYGSIKNAKVIRYYKYSFGVILELQNDLTLELSVGGDKDDIYRYDPFSCIWAEHCAADIESIKCESQHDDTDESESDDEMTRKDKFMLSNQQKENEKLKKKVEELEAKISMYNNVLLNSCTYRIQYCLKDGKKYVLSVE